MLIFETVLIQSFSCFWACLFSKKFESCLFSKRRLLSREYGTFLIQYFFSSSFLCVQIGQSFAAQWVYKKSEEFRNQRHLLLIAAICRFSKNTSLDSLCLEWLTNLAAKGAKRSENMWTTNFCKSFSKIFWC